MRTTTTSTTLRRAARLGSAALALALLAGACSSSDDPTAEATTDTTEVTAAEVTAVPSAGCGTSTTGAVTEERREVALTDPESGETRWYLVTTPPAHDGTTPLPVVVDFHGFTEGAVIHAAHSALSPYAAEQGFVAVFPQGTGNPVRWNALPTADAADFGGADDLSYVDAVLDAIEADLCVDTARIYATGLSNGAGMASLVGCERAGRFAAVAPVAGVRPPAECAEGVATPILGFHGTADPILIYNGGIGDLAGLLGGSGNTAAPEAVLDGEGYPRSIRAWAEHNGCAPEPTKTAIGDDVEHWVFDCPTGADVEFYVIIGGGHTWPGSEFSRNIAAIAGPTSFTISANEVMWDFFGRHARTPA